MPKFRVEAIFEVTGIRAGARDVVILSGHVLEQNIRKADGLLVKEMEIHLHTDDGQSPYPLRHKLKIVVSD